MSDIELIILVYKIILGVGLIGLCVSAYYTFKD